MHDPQGSRLPECGGYAVELSALALASEPISPTAAWYNFTLYVSITEYVCGVWKLHLPNLQEVHGKIGECFPAEMLLIIYGDGILV